MEEEILRGPVFPNQKPWMREFLDAVKACIDESQKVVMTTRAGVERDSKGKTIYLDGTPSKKINRIDITIRMIE